MRAQALRLQLYGAWLIGSLTGLIQHLLHYRGSRRGVARKKGYATVVGAVMVGGLLELVLGLTAKYWRRFVPPIVSAIVVTSIGFSLLNVRGLRLGGGSEPRTGSGGIRRSGLYLWLPAWRSSC